jgi:hypothetical protein
VRLLTAELCLQKNDKSKNKLLANAKNLGKLYKKSETSQAPDTADMKQTDEYSWQNAL